MGENRIVMIGKRFAYRSSHCDVLETADQQFQNGRRKKKIAARSVFVQFSRLPRQRKWRPYEGFLLSGEFIPHRNALKGFQCIPMVFFVSDSDDSG